MQPDICYRIQTPQGQQTRIPIVLAEDHGLDVPAHFIAPDWARLKHCQCRHCPLDPAAQTDCPIARNLAYLLPTLPPGKSYQAILLEVETELRSYRQHTTLQRALGSLFGLICALSDCPHTRFLRPMAVFHLPLSSPMETLVRSTSLYLLKQLMQQPHNPGATVSLNGLHERYDALNTLNQSFVKRFQGREKSDAPVNAMVLLKTISQHMNWNLQDDLAELAPLFEAV